MADETTTTTTTETPEAKKPETSTTTTTQVPESTGGGTAENEAAKTSTEQQRDEAAAQGFQTEVEHPHNSPVLGQDTPSDPVEARDQAQEQARNDALENHAKTDEPKL